MTWNEKLVDFVRRLSAQCSGLLQYDKKGSRLGLAQRLTEVSAWVNCAPHVLPVAGQ